MAEAMHSMALPLARRWPSARAREAHKNQQCHELYNFFLKPRRQPMPWPPATALPTGLCPDAVISLAAGLFPIIV